MSLQKLRDALNRNPATNGKSDAATRTYFTEVVEVDINAQLTAIQQYMMANVDRWAQLNSESGSDASAAWVISLFAPGIKFESVDLTEISVIDALVSLVTNAKIPDFVGSDKAAILALGRTSRKRYLIESIALPAPSDVNKARKL